MLKAVTHEAGGAGVIETSDPAARDNWVIVKVHVAPMCTEYKGYKAGRKGLFLGHEAAGEVVETSRPSRVSAGDRVVVMPTNPCGTCALCLSGEYIHCQNMVDVAAFTGADEGRATMAQLLVKQDWMLPAIPDKISYEHGSLACCGLGPTFGALERTGVDTFSTVLITGMGPVGLGGVINARYRGARVIVAESHPWRCEKAKELGAHEVVHPGERALEQVMDLTDGLGVDAAVDCSGVVAAHRLCIDAVRRKGKVAFVGECGDETPIRISQDMIRKGISLIGSWHYNMNDLPKMMQVIGECPDQLDRLITHTFPLQEIEKAFELQLTGECAKVLLKPWG